jgi:hypothetical protein
MVRKEVHVTIGERTGRDLSARDVTISISLIDEAGAEWSRQRGMSSMRGRRRTRSAPPGWSAGRCGPLSEGQVTDRKFKRSGEAGLRDLRMARKAKVCHLRSGSTRRAMS